MTLGVGHLPLKYSIKGGQRKAYLDVRYLYFYDYLARFSEDVARLKYRHERDLDLTADDFSVDLDVYHVAGNGLQFKLFTPLTDQFSFELSAQLFKANSLLDGEITGHLAYLAEDSIEADLMLQYHYDQDKLLDRPLNRSVSGVGFGLDLGVEWRLSPALHAVLLARDLYRKIDWDDAPYTEGVLRTLSAPVSSDEALVGTSLFYGHETDQYFRQRGVVDVEGRVTLTPAHLATGAGGVGSVSRLLGVDRLFLGTLD